MNLNLLAKYKEKDLLQLHTEELNNKFEKELKIILLQEREDTLDDFL